MQVALPTLSRLLNENVIELKFIRRRVKPGANPTRRMLCTNSAVILNSREGREALHFKPSSKPLRYNPTSRNLIVVWDIFMQDYRTVNVDRCNLIAQIPANDEFWRYFSEVLSKMTPAQKITFMSV